MCHVLLALPILALPVFWLFPFDVAAPLYGTAFTLSVAFYAVALKTMHTPVVTGKEALIHATGVVEDMVDGVPSVRIRGERWSARCESQQLHPGDHVEVVGIEGLTLSVRCKD